MTATLFTIGYARRTQDELIRILREAGIELLADVRALANSRRPGFSKTSLKSAVEEAGMEYRHFRHLGTPTEGRSAARRGDMMTLEKIYMGQLELPETLAEMAQIQYFTAQHRTCLLCYCEEASKCHRGLLAREAFAKFDRIDL